MKNLFYALVVATVTATEVAYLLPTDPNNGPTGGFFSLFGFFV